MGSAKPQRGRGGAHSNKGTAVAGLRPGMWWAGPTVEEPQKCTAGSVPLPDPLPILHGHFGDRRAVFKAWVIGCVTVDSSVSTLSFIEVKIVPGGFGEIPPQAGGPEFKSSAPVNLGMVKNFWNSRVCDVGVREGKMPRTHWPANLAKEVSSRVSEGLYLKR